eukprot:gene21891-33630_t
MQPSDVWMTCSRLLLLLLGALACSVVAKAAYVYVEQRASYAALLKNYDGPVTWPWGGVFERLRNFPRLADMHRENIERYGGGKKSYLLLAPIFSRSFHGGRNEIITADPAVAKHVLQDKFDIYTKSSIAGRAVRGFHFVFGNGIFVADHGPYASNPADGGKAWWTQRRTAVHIFSRSLFQSSYQRVFLSHGSALLQTLSEHVTDGVATVDLQALFFKYTMDCFAEIAFGYRVGDLTRILGEAFDRAHICLLDVHKQSMVGWIAAELLPDFIGQRIVDVGEYFLPAYRTLKKEVAVLDTMLDRIMKLRRADGSALEKANDLLALFMNAKDDDGKPLYSDRQLRDIALNFLLAGRDTTACTLSWMFFELGLPENRSVCSVLEEEINSTLQGESPTYDCLSDMPYLRGVLWETLRMHPVVPLTIAHAMEDDTLPDGSFVPAGTTISVHSFTMGRDKDRWGPDPDVFRPDRWIPFKQPSPYEFPQFKAGRRICLGKDMALYEASIAAIIVLQQFRPELVRAKDEIRRTQKLTMNVTDTVTGKEELWIRLHKRPKVL